MSASQDLLAILFSGGDWQREKEKLENVIAAPDLEYISRISAAFGDKQRGQVAMVLCFGAAAITKTDRNAWVVRLAIGTVNRVLPIMLAEAGLTAEAAKCRAAKTLTEVFEAAVDVEDAAVLCFEAAGKAAKKAAWAAWAASYSLDLARETPAAAESAILAAKAFPHIADKILTESVCVAMDAYAAEARS